MSTKTKLETIFELIEKTGTSAYEIAKHTTLTEAGIGKIISGKTKRPHKNTVNEILNFLENYHTITVNWNPESEKSEVETYVIKNKNGNKFTELKDGSFDVSVDLIPFSAFASYVESLEEGHVEEDFETMVFNVDRVGRGNYKAFIVKGDSMNGGNINDTPDGAKVLGRELGKHHWKDGFNPTQYGWIILSTQNIFHKDIIDFNPETGMITCHSRNTSPEYSNFSLALNDCYQIFKVIKRIF